MEVTFLASISTNFGAPSASPLARLEAITTSLYMLWHCRINSSMGTLGIFPPRVGLQTFRRHNGFEVIDCGAQSVVDDHIIIQRRAGPLRLALGKRWTNT